MPTFDNELLLIILDSLNVSHHPYTFHVMGKIKLFLFIVNILGFSLVGRIPSIW